jgi:hypothetical protein
VVGGLGGVGAKWCADVEVGVALGGGEVAQFRHRGDALVGCPGDDQRVGERF